MSAIFPSRVVATSAGAYYLAVDQETVDGVPSYEVGAGDEEPQSHRDSPYQNSDDDEIQVEFGRREAHNRRGNACNVTSSSRLIRKRSARARKSNDSTRQDILDVVREMRDDLHEDIRSNKKSLLSAKTVNGLSEASVILTSLAEMGLDPRT